MKTLSLSVSNPSNANGSSLRISVNATVSTVCSRTSSGAHSVQPVAISVKTKVCVKAPFANGPECATRSASTKPGAGLFQSENVRTGTLRLITVEPLRRRCPVALALTPLRIRSIVAALMAKSCCRFWSSSPPCPWRSIASISSGSKGCSRLPQIRSDASQANTRAARTASSSRLSRYIVVHAETRDGSFELWVANAGQPIPPSSIEKLFEPFFRGKARASRQGLGLGLYIASQIARAHGGILTVALGLAETRFTFSMPLG